MNIPEERFLKKYIETEFLSFSVTVGAVGPKGRGGGALFSKEIEAIFNSGFQQIELSLKVLEANYRKDFEEKASRPKL